MVSVTAAHTLTVPAGYGYVMMVAVGALPLFAWLQGLYVALSRSRAGVPLPHAYATPQQTKSNPKAYRFNCAQRAHGNLLENMTQVIITTLIAGLKYPRGALGLITGWMLLRSVYWGVLWGMSLSVASDLLCGLYSSWTTKSIFQTED